MGFVRKTTRDTGGFVRTTCTQCAPPAHSAHHLHTVRKAAKLTQGSAAGLSKLNVTSENASSTLHVEVQLLQAERAWVYAMDQRELHSRTEELRQRQQVVQRLKAAANAVHTLTAIAREFCDARTALAAAASTLLLLQSQLRFELQRWETALDSAALVHMITDRLAQAGSSGQAGLLKAASDDSSDSLDAVVAAYRKVGKAARCCYSESAVAVQKSQTTALDALLSAYVAVQLYSICVLSAIGMTQLANEAQSIVHACSTTSNSASAQLVWLAGPWTGDKNTPQQPSLVQVVVYYNKVDQCLAVLQHSVTETKARLLLAVCHEICTQQIADKVVAAKAYYTCLHNYHLALLHVLPACTQYVDLLALLDVVVVENILHTTALTDQLTKCDMPPDAADTDVPCLCNLAHLPY
ncbi:signal recognition particle subunit srp68 [Coemansia sp. RSA 1199]|nr:signal recognition particle subunit srp68 [Coemansia sp. RSA 1199]